MRILILFLSPFILSAQVNWGAQVGLSASVGSHHSAIGLFGRCYVNYKFIQFNYSSDIQYNTHSYAQRKNMVEFRNALGTILLAGKEERDRSFVLDALQHNTSKNLGLGYSFLHYWDNKSSSQFSGGFGLHVSNFAILLENDVFAGQAKDRFRTGHARIVYSDSACQFALGVNLWTGETANTTWRKVCSPKMPNGYRMLEEQAYGGTSHGILYLEGRLNGPFDQQPGIRIGIDSEEIRHQIQNRWFHDLVFMPKKFERSTPHYPRVDENGCAVFDRQYRRKDRLFVQLGLNDYEFH